MDIKKHKYKGAICAPPSRHKGNKKNTAEWCKGKIGIEHDWRWFHRTDRGPFGVPSEEYKKCFICDKQSFEHRGIRYSFGNAVRIIRENRGLTQTQLADILGLPQNLISATELGNGSPTLTTMEKYCAAMGVKLRVEILPDVRSYDTLMIGT